VLKVSMAPSFGITHILPLLPAFRARYPQVRPEWLLENRPVDLIAEGYDLAIGGGFELAQGLVARPLAPAHIIAVAAPAYLAGRVAPTGPQDLAGFDGIVMRATRSGRVRHWTLRDNGGNEMAAPLAETIMLNDPAAMREAALLGLGVALLAVPDVLPWLERGELVRLLPRWYADAGSISLYYPSRTLLPAKTRAFIDFLAEHFQREQLARRFAASFGA
jgi:DNA-binding transcriptional LysR family regulator